MDSPKPVRTRRTAEDVDALMAQGVDASAETLVQVALDRGLYLSPSDAAGFIESVVVEERARALLAERGYHELQKALRLRAPPKPLAPPLTRAAWGHCRDCSAAGALGADGGGSARSGAALSRWEQRL